MADVMTAQRFREIVEWTHREPKDEHGILVYGDEIEGLVTVVKAARKLMYATPAAALELDAALRAIGMGPPDSRPMGHACTPARITPCRPPQREAEGGQESRGS